MADDVEPLTTAQRAMLVLVEEHIETWGYPPSLRDLAEAHGCTVHAVQDALAILERKGYISRDPRIARAIRVRKSA